MNRAQHHENYQDDWATPADLFERLDKEHGPFDLDAAASDWSAKVPGHYLTKEQDALRCDWRGRRVFLNPPFGREIGCWLRKVRDEMLRRGGPELICCVLPANTDTSWFHELVIPYAEDIEFLRGRVQFERPDGVPGRNTTGTMIAVYRRTDGL